MFAQSPQIPKGMIAVRKRIRIRTRIRDAWQLVAREGDSLLSSITARALAGWDMRRPRKTAVALGFAGWKAGGGGVRRHLDAIRAKSTHVIRILPGDKAIGGAHRGAYISQFVSLLSGDRLSRFAVVHSHVDPDFVRGCARARAFGSRWVHTYHSLYLEEEYGPLKPWQVEMNRTLVDDARHADVCISVSPWLQKFLREKHGIETVFIPNGVDIELCNQANAARFTKRTGLSEFVVFVGSLDDVKNPRLFIDLAAARPDIRFVMIGRNLTSDSIEPWYGRTLPRNLDAIGPLDHSSTLDAIAASRAMVMTSNFEGLPTSLMEGMALGKPVIATDAFGCRDAVGDDSCGVLFEPRSLLALERAFDKALASPDLGFNAAERVRRLFDWKVVMPRIDEIYSDLIGPPHD